MYDFNFRHIEWFNAFYIYIYMASLNLKKKNQAVV